MNHYGTAQGLYNTAAEGANMAAEHQATIASLAQVQATLSLAYEQRTANLIALWMDPLEVSERGMYGVNYVQLAEQIRERLGIELEPAKTPKSTEKEQ